METENTNKTRPKRIIFEVNDELFKEVKRKALDLNITMRKWMVRAVLEKIKREENYE